MKIEKKTLLAVFFGAVGCSVVYWLLHETERVTAFFHLLRRIFSPFFVGAALAFILNVPMRGIEGLLRGVKNPSVRRALAIVGTLLALLLVLALVFYLLIPQIGATITSLVPKLVEFFNEVQAAVTDWLNENPKLMQWVTDNTELEKLNWAALLQRAATLLGNSISTIMDKAFSAIGSVSSAVVDALIGIVFAVYCLFRKEILARQGRRLLYAFLPEKVCDEIVRILRLTNATFSNFISGQCLEACILGALFAVSMAIFRMPYVPLVSVLVAVTALVPLVGAFVGCVLGAFFILVDNPLMAVWFVVMFLVLQQIENNLIYPRVVGTSIGLPGMWVLVAVAVGGEIMGIGGMLLMIPLASVLYTLLREITARRLAARGVADEKLQDHPPELQSRFKERRAKKRNRHPKADKPDSKEKP